MTAPVRESLQEFEYSHPCIGCDSEASWAAWSSHAREGHRALDFYACTSCKVRIEDDWAEFLDLDGKCVCGWVAQGLVEDNFKAIAL